MFTSVCGYVWALSQFKEDEVSTNESSNISTPQGSCEDGMS